MSEGISCTDDELLRFEGNGGILLEFLALFLLFYAMMLLTDDYLMGKG
jgi:hypothetical protein